MSAIAISALERGHRRKPQLKTLRLLSDALALRDEQRAEFEAAARATRRPTSSAVTVGPWLGAVSPNNLPHQVTSLIGRTDDLAKIAPLLSVHQVVTLVGAGGVGKTRLALEAGQSLLREYADGVWLVELADFDQPASLVQTLASCFGLRDGDERPLLDVVLEYLRSRRLLIILDNCEHLIDEAARVVDALVRRASNVRVIATSREPLRISAEQIQRVAPLPEPFAIELFAERAQAARAEFALTDSNAATVAKICKRLDGVPLAIELAAARTSVLSATEIAERLDRRFSILTGSQRASVPRQQTLRALIDWSYQLLTESERVLLRSLGVFSGDFSFDSVATMHGPDPDTVFDLLASLAEKSLVHVETIEESTRFRLHESVRAYAHEQLIAHGELQAASLAHARAYLTLAEQLNSAWDDIPDVEWKAEAEPELENWRAALRWSFASRGDLAVALRLIAALRPVWFTLAPGEGLAWVRKGLDACDDSQPESIKAWLELSASHLSMLTQHYKDAAEAARRALAGFSKLDERRGRALARLFAAAARGMLGESESSKSDLRAALDECNALGARRAVAAALLYLAALELGSGDAGAARPLFAEALMLFKNLGASRPAAHVALNLAELEFTNGNPVEALRLANEALEADSALNDRDSVAYDLCNIAAYECALRRWEASVTHACAALRLARERGMTGAVAWTIQHLAATAALRPISNPALAIEQRRRAAHLLGFVDARVAEYGLHRDFTERSEREQIVAAVRETLGAETDAFAEDGSTWSEARAFEESLQVGKGA